MNTGTPGKDKIQEHGWLSAHRWLLLRRITQLTTLGIFLVGPLTGFWLVKGNLASSLTLDTLALTDPYVILQSFFAGHAVQTTALAGGLIVLIFYLLIGGRVYCSWVCPVNIVTDAAAWLRNKLGIKGNAVHFNRNTRYWLFGLTLILALMTGSIVWELVNPVSMLFRGLLFGIGLAWITVLAVFLFDLFVSRRGWCGHLCPVGAFYSLPAKFSIVRIGALHRERCNDCMDCFAVCPEPQVISPPLKNNTHSPVILSPNCTNCGRCVDVCNKNVFQFCTRFHQNSNTHNVFDQMEVMP